MLPLWSDISVDRWIERRVVPPAAPVPLAAGVALRPHQVAALDAWRTEESGVVVAPCGAGKTMIGLGAIAAVNTPALVLVHTLDLARQWVERCGAQLADAEVGLVGGGKDQGDRRIVVATIQTLARRPWWETYQWAQRFGLVILDEAHHVPASTFLGVVGAIPARHRLALTATPERPDGLHPLLYWSFGGESYRIEQAAMEAKGLTLTPEIRTVWTGWLPPEDCEEPHQREAAMAEDEERNALILSEAEKLMFEGRRVLILTRLVKHCRALAADLEAAGWPARALVGPDSPRVRAEVLAELARAGGRAVVATTVADEGLDVPEIDAVILAAPSRNAGAVQQRIGRACRPMPGKKRPVVVDVCDDFGPYRRAASVRWALYRRLGWL